MKITYKIDLTSLIDSIKTIELVVSHFLKKLHRLQIISPPSPKEKHTMKIINTFNGLLILSIAISDKRANSLSIRKGNTHETSNQTFARKTGDELPLEEEPPWCPSQRYTQWESFPVKYRTRTLFLKLGYNADSWNFEPLEWFWNPIENFAWNDTRTKETTHMYAAELGYDEDRWDCCINHYEGFDWKELETNNYTEQIDALSALGWSSESYGKRNSSVWPETEGKYWQNLTEYQKFMAASKLCFTEETWDERLPLYEWPEDFDVPDYW